jgi:hypothetical protein
MNAMIFDLTRQRSRRFTYWTYANVSTRSLAETHIAKSDSHPANIKIHPMAQLPLREVSLSSIYKYSVAHMYPADKVQITL